MDVDRLTVEERDKLLKEGKCFRCRKTGHWANECPEDDDKKKGKEVPKKKMNGVRLRNVKTKHLTVSTLSVRAKKIASSRGWNFVYQENDYKV
jgi:Zinc knuckle